MLLSILERRKIIESLVRSLLVVKVDPSFSSPQKLSQGMVGAAICHRQLEQADKPFRIPIIGGCACPAHRKDKAFLQEQLTSLSCPILLALIAVPNRIRHLKADRLDRLQDQFRTHVVIKSYSQHLAGSMAQRKTAPHPRPIAQLYLQTIAEHHFYTLQVDAFPPQLIC